MLHQFEIQIEMTSSNHPWLVLLIQKSAADKGSNGKNLENEELCVSSRYDFIKGQFAATIGNKYHEVEGMYTTHDIMFGGGFFFPSFASSNM